MKVLRFIKQLGGGGDFRLTRSPESRKAACQAINVILNLFQDLVIRCEDAERQRGVVCNVKKYYPLSGEGLRERVSKAAFTLAEVLITLGIIGVVAAITMPVIVHKYRTNVLKNQFKKSYSVLSQALTLTSKELGGNLHEMFKDEPAGFSGAILFRDTFYKFLIPAADLKESTDIFKFAPYNKNQPSDSESATMGLGAYPGYVVLGDGSAITVLKNNGRLNVLVDINGLKRPNRVGYDVFLFVVDTKKDILTSWSTDAATYCSKTSTNSYNGRACTYYAMIDRNPDDDSKGYWDTLDF